MEILVCIKQVADDSVEVFMNEKTGKPALEGVEKVVNAFDTYALEMAVRLKEAKGDTTVTTLSLGGEDAKNIAAIKIIVHTILVRGSIW